MSCRDIFRMFMHGTNKNIKNTKIYDAKKDFMKLKYFFTYIYVLLKFSKIFFFIYCTIYSIVIKKKY